LLAQKVCEANLAICKGQGRNCSEKGIATGLKKLRKVKPKRRESPLAGGTIKEGLGA